MARAKPAVAFPRKPNPPPAAAADAFVETGRAPAAEPAGLAETAAPRASEPAAEPPPVAAPAPPAAVPAASDEPAARPARAPKALAPSPSTVDLPTGRAVMQLKDGRRVRRTTMLLEEEIAQRLDVFAAKRGVDKAAVVNALLRTWLSENGE